MLTFNEINIFIEQIEIVIKNLLISNNISSLDISLFDKIKHKEKYSLVLSFQKNMQGLLTPVIKITLKSKKHSDFFINIIVEKDKNKSTINFIYEDLYTYLHKKLNFTFLEIIKFEEIFNKNVKKITDKDIIESYYKENNDNIITTNNTENISVNKTDILQNDFSQNKSSNNTPLIQTFPNESSRLYQNRYPVRSLTEKESDNSVSKKLENTSSFLSENISQFENIPQNDIDQQHTNISYCEPKDIIIRKKNIVKTEEQDITNSFNEQNKIIKDEEDFINNNNENINEDITKDISEIKMNIENNNEIETNTENTDEDITNFSEDINHTLANTESFKKIFPLIKTIQSDNNNQDNINIETDTDINSDINTKKDSFSLDE